MAKTEMCAVEETAVAPLVLFCEESFDDVGRREGVFCSTILFGEAVGTYDMYHTNDTWYDTCDTSSSSSISVAVYSMTCRGGPGSHTPSIGLHDSALFLGALEQLGQPIYIAA